MIFMITELKPFLAYMSVFHSLYILAALVSVPAKGSSLALFYLYIYLFSMFQFFGMYLSLQGKKIRYLSDFQQLPRLPVVLGGAICSFAAMSGLPPFLGFWGKLVVIFSLVGNRHYTLGIVCLTGGLMVLYFYFQNYRFIGVAKSGLLYRPVRVNWEDLILVLIVILGFFLNFSIIFFILDIYG